VGNVIWLYQGGESMGEITYHDIADYFIALSNYHENLITNKKLQKMMYYAQAWHLAIFDEPLFDGEFEAWVHGPVLPSLYQDYKDFKWHPIIIDELDEEKFSAIKRKLGKEKLQYLEELIEEYFGLSAYELERLTHIEEPWKKARSGISPEQSSDNIIEQVWMKEYYSKFLKS